jgi:hypothetical protein
MGLVMRFDWIFCVGYGYISGCFYGIVLDVIALD